MILSPRGTQTDALGFRIRSVGGKRLIHHITFRGVQVFKSSIVPAMVNRRMQAAKRWFKSTPFKIMVIVSVPYLTQYRTRTTNPTVLMYALSGVSDQGAAISPRAFFSGLLRRSPEMNENLPICQPEYHHAIESSYHGWIQYFLSKNPTEQLYLLEILRQSTCVRRSRERLTYYPQYSGTALFMNLIGRIEGACYKLRNSTEL
ncbi:hypothetical protein CROQUDRAFT_705414 [Cronartium quercuum f. sp. fusiforme G11]|uniref:Uncharacterized protein n=1 Tax=Cronartium quercuum f. sp. fusiforme G11 TaxID=708437 RepID=A0A9P6TBD0_9BASI|nr:hypothetical protein CROQUDRAFT_705414 [Cronartium quercuum f. sp. fusiforme G11]